MNRNLNKNRKKINRFGKDPKNWTNRMKGIPCFLIGNAPSLNKMPVEKLENYFTIGINRSFYKMDATILLWQDLALWLQEEEKVRQSKSIKFCRSAASNKKKYYTFTLVGRKYKLPITPCHMHGRGSSGAIAFQLAFILGCDPIILVGMDCKNDKKTGYTDFYGVNPMHRSHTIPSCKEALRWIRDCKSGRKIINCSKNNIFPERLKIEEVIESFGDIEPQNREKLVKKLLGDD
jgi:hypothetical protein